MLMVLLGIMVSQSMPLLVGGVADVGERLVESKVLECPQSGAASWRGNRDGLLLECGGLDCCVFAEDGGGSGRLYGGVALALGPALKRLRGLLWPMFLIGLDPVLRDWWLSWIVNASWLGVSSTSKSDRLLVFFFSSNCQGCVCLVVAVMAVCSSTTFYILLVFCYL
jgi:hypothetical protein